MVDIASDDSAAGHHVKIAVLMTSHDRRELTLTCLASLFDQRGDYYYRVFLVDDGSRDGTGEAVETHFPSVEVVRGTGDLYWAGGMRVAYETALATETDWSHYLWLNDDTILSPHAITTLLATEANAASSHPLNIVVGALADPSTGLTTYSGVERKSALRPLRFTRIEPSDSAIECETINGNVVLVPDHVARLLGALDPFFRHAMGDFDYGLRARRLGVRNLIAPGHLGSGSRNPESGTYRDTNLTFRQRLAHLRSMKGLPHPDWLHFAARYGGRFWPVYWVIPFVRLVVSHLISHCTRRPLSPE